jgi:hypothetical protein
MNNPECNSGGLAQVATYIPQAIPKGLNMNNPDCNSGGLAQEATNTLQAIP